MGNLKGNAERAVRNVEQPENPTATENQTKMATWMPLEKQDKEPEFQKERMEKAVQMELDLVELATSYAVEWRWLTLSCLHWRVSRGNRR